MGMGGFLGDGRLGAQRKFREAPLAWSYFLGSGPDGNPENSRTPSRPLKKKRPGVHRRASCTRKSGCSSIAGRHEGTRLTCRRSGASSERSRGF